MERSGWDFQSHPEDLDTQFPLILMEIGNQNPIGGFKNLSCKVMEVFTSIEPLINIMDPIMHNAEWLLLKLIGVVCAQYLIGGAQNCAGSSPLLGTYGLSQTHCSWWETFHWLHWTLDQLIEQSMLLRSAHRGDTTHTQISLYPCRRTITSKELFPTFLWVPWRALIDLKIHEW